MKYLKDYLGHDTDFEESKARVEADVKKTVAEMDDTTTEKYRQLTEVQEKALSRLSDEFLSVLLASLTEEIGKLNVTMHIKKVRRDMVQWEMHKRWTQGGS